MADNVRFRVPVKSRSHAPATALFGAAAFLVLVLIWVAVRHSRQKPWNDTAITATFVKLTVRKGQKDVHLILTYKLTNNTGDKYRLPPPGSSELMRKTPGGAMNEVDSVLWDQETPIPAHGAAVEEFDISQNPMHYDLDIEELDTHDKLMSFVNSRLANIRGLEFADYIHHYNIELPRGWN
jgi:hypothetical protein